MKLKTRYLKIEDLEWLRQLRNRYREAFFKTGEITPDQQWIWFSTRPWTDEHYVIMADKPIGYFAFVSPNPELPVFQTAPGRGRIRYLNSLLVVPEWHGKGVMTSMVKPLISEAMSYVGYVREGNAASLRTCIKIGLEGRGIYEHPVYGRLHVLWRG
jgi:RimJ/RimL family protein N-acetyltransferase